MRRPHRGGAAILPTACGMAKTRAAQVYVMGVSTNVSTTELTAELRPSLNVVVVPDHGQRAWRSAGAVVFLGRGSRPGGGKRVSSRREHSSAAVPVWERLRERKVSGEDTNAGQATNSYTTPFSG